MDYFKINANACLTGEISASGSKNAALPILAATLLTKNECIIKNVPNLSDVSFMLDILKQMGANVENVANGAWKIVASDISTVAPYELVKQMRASICLLGPLVARCKKAKVSMPGGCVIGQRPIDLHIKGLKKLNCDVQIENGYINVDASNAKGSEIFLGGRFGSTVTGTANILMASVLIKGKTKIESAAQEPEIEDLCNMLVKMGAKISGIGSHTLVIEGVKSLNGVVHSVVPDRIEAGTYLIAALATKGNLLVKNAKASHLGALIDVLETSGAKLEITKNAIKVDAKKTKLNSTEIITLAYPGFPTDLQAQMCALLSITKGISIITERIYPSRFMHVSELQRMGANISIEGASAIINGVSSLSAAPIMASDLRASASLVIAGLAAKEGQTLVHRIYHLDRGYDKMELKLNNVGANIQRLKE